MTPQSALETKGNFFTHPFAELLIEIAQASLNGSLRVAKDDTKCVVYFKSGKIAFCVSNARSTRIFDTLLRRNKIAKEDLVKIPNFSNDFELTQSLVGKGLLTKDESDRLFKDQIEGILIDILSWPAADWTFSPLARIRDGLSFAIDINSHLVNYSRCMTDETILNRFRSLEETFRRSAVSEIGCDLNLEEAFVLSRAVEEPLSASNIINLSAMPEIKVLHALYTLWMGGLLIRDNWNPAFSPHVIANIRSARLELKTDAKERPVAAASEPATDTNSNLTTEVPERIPETMLTLDEYLDRVENAQTYYDILGVDNKAEAAELKLSYFSLAKNFHPDRYHAEGGAILKRVQNAFTELAQAHETLKNAESREVYDYRMRKELVEREKRLSSGANSTTDLLIERAAENFERGFSLLMENKVVAAIPFLARAAHFAPQNARYRGYYGRALTGDEKQRHKAEAELQSALRIDPNNETFRLMLAEFFIQVNLLKRAEGELNRLLAIFPSNAEAKSLLERLRTRP